jgi:GNAT superfamily N-acetyltransferase
MAGFSVKPLDESTWPAFARLVERHNGIWGGCWCMSFHAEGVGRGKTAAQNRSEKESRVREGGAHAALVHDGTTCVGWCQFGPTAELPRIKNRRAYQDGLTALPDWRITCFFVDKSYRGKGVASLALEGALREIARLGGGHRHPPSPPHAACANPARSAGRHRSRPCSRARAAPRTRGSASAARAAPCPRSPRESRQAPPATPPASAAAGPRARTRTTCPRNVEPSVPCCARPSDPGRSP